MIPSKMLGATAALICCAFAHAGSGTITVSVTINSIFGPAISTGSVEVVNCNGIPGPSAELPGSGTVSWPISWAGSGSVTCTVQTVGTRFADASAAAQLDSGGTSNFAFVLAPVGSVISGTVADAAAGTPVTTASITFYDANGAALDGAETDGAGAFIFGGLSASETYYARAEAGGFVDEVWSGLSCFQGQCAITSGSPIVPSQIADLAFQLYPIEVFADGFESP